MKKQNFFLLFLGFLGLVKTRTTRPMKTDLGYRNFEKELNPKKSFSKKFSLIASCVIKEKTPSAPPLDKAPPSYEESEREKKKALRKKIIMKIQ